MTETPTGPEQPEQPEQHPSHEHGLSEELHRIEDEAYVDSYQWGPVILGVLLAIALIGVAIVGWVWFA